MDFLSFEGRVNRKPYVVVTLLMFALRFLALPFVVHGESSMVAFQAISAILFALTFPIGVRRLHDLDKSGFWVLGMFVPLLNLYVILIMLFQKGTSGPNRYGYDPLGG